MVLGERLCLKGCSLSAVPLFAHASSPNFARLSSLPPFPLIVFFLTFFLTTHSRFSSKTAAHYTLSSSYFYASLIESIYTTAVSSPQHGSPSPHFDPYPHSRKRRQCNTHIPTLLANSATLSICHYPAILHLSASPPEEATQGPARSLHLRLSRREADHHLLVMRGSTLSCSSSSRYSQTRLRAT